jgi:hypothetical protein
LKKIILSFLLFGCALFAQAQYYYKDIISNKQLLADMAAYKENKVTKITIKSFEDNGIESESFFCEKKISKNYKKTELFTRADLSSPSLFLSEFSADGKLLQTNDSSTISVTKIKYSYNNNGQISSIKSFIRSGDDDFASSIIEEHIYMYENNQVAKMVKVKNETDSTFILFSLDEKGNVAVEKDTKNATKYYYYYDAKNRLTDIVPATEYSKSLKPDYLFEYNSAGQITQMTAVEEGSSNYFVWKYSYADGMRVREKCFTNERRLMGSIEYEYK